MGREFKALYCNLFSFKKGIRLEYKPEVCLPNILNIPTTITKAAGMLLFILLYFFFPAAVESLPLPSLDIAGPSLPEDIPGAQKNTSKDFIYLFIYFPFGMQCQIFSKHFPRDSTPINSSHILFLTFHTLSAVLSTDLQVLPQESG